MSVKKKFGMSPVILAVLAIFAFSAANIMAESDLPNKNPVADVSYGGNSVSFLPKVDHSAITLTIDGPNGLICQKTFSGGAAPHVNLSDYGPIIDGQYRYELVVIPVGQPKIRKDAELESTIKKNSLNGLNNNIAPTTQSGSFRVMNGMIVNGMNSPEPQKVNDQVILDDLIVDGSLCVGQDCVNGESFGFDTLRLKENNLRVHFQDTSNSASFPTNDWRITINDSANGGGNYFGIDDVSSGRRVFILEAGAPANAIYLDSGGDLGIGTSAPVVDIHVANGNTPTLRLEQNGSSGFTPQTWDLAGNEANFFIRDVSNGSELSFRIQPGAPSNSVYIANTGNVGFGTSSPNSIYDIHVYEPAGGAMIVAERGDGATMEMSVTKALGVVGTRSAHPLVLRVNNKPIVQINDNATDRYIQVKDVNNNNLGYYDTTWNDASSRDLKENIVDFSDSEAEAALEELQPVQYNYKHQQDETRLGFIAEDVPEIVAHGDRKAVSSMDFIALLTKIVKKQQKTIDKLNKRVEQLEKKK